MTRAEIADALDESDPTGDALDAAVVELRKTCATCRWFENYDGPACGRTIAMNPPADGSGFCHLWQAERDPLSPL